MHLEMMRAITDWLAGTRLDYQGADQGVNAQMAGVPRDAGDPEPEPVQFFGDVTRDNAVAVNAHPVNAPAIFVTPSTPAEADGEALPGPPGVRDARNVGIAIRYIRRDANTADAFRDTSYTLRAIIKSLKQLARSDNSAARLRNSIQMKAQIGLTWGLATEWEGNAAVTGAVISTWTVRDLAP